MAEKTVITTLETQVRRLMAGYRKASDSCRELERECNALKAENRSLREQVRTLGEELARVRLSEGLGGPAGDRDKARARINRLMREVDRCIALLSKQPVGAGDEEARM